MKLDSIAHEDYEKQEHISDVMAMVERIVIRERNAFYEAGYAEGYAERDKEMEDACNRLCEACEDKCLPWEEGYNQAIDYVNRLLEIDSMEMTIFPHHPRFPHYEDIPNMKIFLSLIRGRKKND